MAARAILAFLLVGAAACGGAADDRAGFGGGGGEEAFVGDPERDCLESCTRIGACWHRAGRTMTDLELADCAASCTTTMPARNIADCVRCQRDAITCERSQLVCFDGEVCTPPRLDIELAGEGFDAWEGREVLLTVLEWQETRFGTEARIVGGKFSANLRARYMPGWTHRLHVLVDVDGDRACSEHDVWFAQELEPRLEPHRVTVVPPEFIAPFCIAPSGHLPARLFAKGTGFAALDGRWAVVALARTERGIVFRQHATAAVRDGVFAVRLEPHSGSGEHRLAWMIDDGDWRCEEDEDLGGTAVVGPIDGDDVDVAIDRSGASSGFCAALGLLGHDVTLRAGPWPDDDQDAPTARALLLDEGGNQVNEDAARVIDGSVELTFAGTKMDDARYRVAAYVDRDHDGHCTSADTPFSIEVPATPGDVAIERSSAELPADASACAFFERRFAD